VIDADQQARIVIWEFLSQWKRNAILSVCDYVVRAMIKYSLPVEPLVLLLAPSSQAVDCFEEGRLRFGFTLIPMYALVAAEFLHHADVHLLPFVPVMQGGLEALWEAEHRIYVSSELASEDKAELLTALAIFAGLRDKQLAQQLVQRRRDLMLESYTYEIIKQEGRQEGRQEGWQEGRISSWRESLCDVLETRFEMVPMAVINDINRIDNVRVLEELLRTAVKASSMQGFQDMLRAVVAPA
jgi:hypothetical protein